jgi:hypothetical protein
MNEKLIKQLKEGEIAVHNDGTIEELREVLKYAFPKDGWYIHGATKYYISSGCTQWIATDKANLPLCSVKEFLKEKTMIDKINDEFIVDCTSNTTEERREVYKFLVDNRGYNPSYLMNDYANIVCNKTEGTTNFRSLENSKSYYPSYPVLTFQEFKQKYLNMEEKKIIGYKLTKPEYKEVALKISNTYGNWENTLSVYDISITQKNYINRLQEAGVLDLWFEPVYEEEEFKVGDYITVVENNHTIAYNGIVGETYKIIKIVGEFFLFYDINNCINTNNVKVRKATEEEIKKAQSIELPKINGYHGKIEGDFLVYGCAKFAIRNIKDLCEDILSFNNPDERLEKYSGGNRIIISIQLSSGVTMTTTHLEIILKYLNQKGL